jgi:hypothetical protein
MSAGCKACLRGCRASIGKLPGAARLLPAETFCVPFSEFSGTIHELFENIRNRGVTICEKPVDW